MMIEVRSIRRYGLNMRGPMKKGGDFVSATFYVRHEIAASRYRGSSR
jgi:hypothetical protein